jgi:hypothetical protein
MDASDPQSLASAVAAMLGYAAEQAQQASNDALHNVFDQFADLPNQAQQLPGDVLDTLRSACDPPDWWSLLVFVMVKLNDILQSPKIWIGAAQPSGWSRMLTLNYSPDAESDAPALTVGLAVTDSGCKHGIWINLSKDFDPDTINAQAPYGLSLTLSGTGTSSWNYPFDGQAPSVNLPGVSASAEASISYSPPWSGISNPIPNNPVFDLSLGNISADVLLASSNPLYHLEASIGPLGGTLTPQGALGSGLAAQLLTLSAVEVSYNPTLVVEQGKPPVLTLGT